MVAKLRKAHLRECARKALEDDGYSVEDVGGPGVVPGARLRISKGPKAHTVAVRTSLERKIGLVRNANGGWMTVPSVDRVIVVTPSAEDPNCAEVLSFTSDAIIKAFNEVLAERKESKPNFSPKAPIFVALDASRRGKATKRGLKELSKWKREVPLASVSGQQSSNEVRMFVDRTKREFAQLIGVAEEDVTVQFLIKR